jgi:hypothetical protein
VFFPKKVTSCLSASVLDEYIKVIVIVLYRLIWILIQDITSVVLPH